MIALLAALLLGAAHADALDADAYARRFGLVVPDQGQREVLAGCLAQWPDAPFSLDGDPRVRVIAPSVRVMGFGQEVRDDAATAYPQLILVEPPVSILSGTTYRLLNPQGWYCLDASVSVMGRLTIEAACDAHLATARKGATVVGEDDGVQGVTVLGKTEVRRVGCED